MRTIDLNADVGEGSGNDAELIPLVTSANIACGGHAGDSVTMLEASRVAIESGVVIGAHPGHEDPQHFGRRELPITPADLFDLLNRQANRLHAVVRGLGGEVRYLKLHGALYHQAGRDPALAHAVVEFVHDFHVPLAVFGQRATALADTARVAGIDFAEEAFADRTYRPDGSLVPRSEAGAVLTTSEEITSHALSLAKTDCDSLCLHGDGKDAVAHAKAVRSALAAAGIGLRAFAG
ncbi:MAG: 5-oxoprolinase subunit PxpA [Planctomycetota bacterium]